MYKEKLNKLREDFLQMQLEEVAKELEKYAHGLDIDITIVDKEDSGIFFKDEQ